MKPIDKNIGLSMDRLRSLLRYEEATGQFIWYSLPHPSASNIKIGDVAGSADNTGYIRITIDGKRYLAHRLAWFYVHGEWPQDRIDHENGIKSDNRLANLREASDHENSGNAAVQKNNFLGVKGVRLHECGKYQARIYVGGRNKHIGLFDTPEQASEAYYEAAKKHFGEFARQ